MTNPTQLVPPNPSLIESSQSSSSSSSQESPIKGPTQSMPQTLLIEGRALSEEKKIKKEKRDHKERKENSKDRKGSSKDRKDRKESKHKKDSRDRKDKKIKKQDNKQKKDISSIKDHKSDRKHTSRSERKHSRDSSRSKKHKKQYQQDMHKKDSRGKEDRDSKGKEDRERKGREHKQRKEKESPQTKESSKKQESSLNQEKPLEVKSVTPKVDESIAKIIKSEQVKNIEKKQYSTNKPIQETKLQNRVMTTITVNTNKLQSQFKQHFIKQHLIKQQITKQQITKQERVKQHSPKQKGKNKKQHKEKHKHKKRDRSRSEGPKRDRAKQRERDKSRDKERHSKHRKDESHKVKDITVDGNNESIGSISQLSIPLDTADAVIDKDKLLKAFEQEEHMDTFARKGISEEERQRIIARRKVKARLFKLNEIYQSDHDDAMDSDSDEAENRLKLLKIQQQQEQSQSKPRVKKSRWNKTQDNDESILPEPTPRATPNLQPTKSLSLDIEPSEDFKLSQDKSMDVEEPQQNQLANTAEDEIDPLDAYMNEVQGKAVPQMDLPRRTNDNVITYEDIVTKQQVVGVQEIEANSFKNEFMLAINTIEERKTKQLSAIRKENGVIMDQQEADRSGPEDFKGDEQVELDFFAKQRKLAERKELTQIDHAKIKYEDVRFDLYREAEEVKNMDPEEVQNFRKEAGDIKIRGKDLLNPVFNWFQMGFSDKVLGVIEKRKYQKPFPIQAQSIPLLLSGRDVIGIAQTGSGKTLAYLLPAIRHVMEQRPVQQGEGPISLIMTPTRQLARQVYLEAKAFCRPMNIRVLAVYGGLDIQKQLSAFRQGCEIVICTPGRLIDILTLNKGKVTNLQRVTMIIVDEADRMFDLGFEPQISRIIDNVRPKRQTVMFSATFPRNVETLARKILTKPVEIVVGSRGQVCRNVQQIIQVREETSKFLRLLELLGNWHEKGSVLIFVDKQTEVDYLFQELLKYGYQSLILHGAMDPDDREFTIYDFTKGIKTIMVATSICARGLDIRSIILVVNFKCPNHLQDYIHRIGRTGRAGNKGTAVTFITPNEDQYSLDMIKALELSGKTAPEELVEMGKQYMLKVKRGQAYRSRNLNIRGIGYKFDQEEQQKVGQIKDMFKKQMKTEGHGFDDSDDDDIELKKKREQETRGRNQQEKIAQAIKNPQVKTRLLNDAVKAVSEAIKEGSALTTDKLLEIAVNSMKESVTKYKVARSAEQGAEQVSKLISQFSANSKANGQQEGDHFSYDFEINDYPLGARQKACNQAFLQTIQMRTNCSISLRGTFVEPGKKIQMGCRKLYLHIQGENKYYVDTAYKEIKRVIEESAYQNMHMRYAIMN